VEAGPERGTGRPRGSQGHEDGTQTYAADAIGWEKGLEPRVAGLCCAEEERAKVQCVAWNIETPLQSR